MDLFIICLVVAMVTTGLVLRVGGNKIHRAEVRNKRLRQMIEDIGMTYNLHENKEKRVFIIDVNPIPEKDVWEFVDAFNNSIKKMPDGDYNLNYNHNAQPFDINFSPNVTQEYIDKTMYELRKSLMIPKELIGEPYKNNTFK